MPGASWDDDIKPSFAGIYLLFADLVKLRKHGFTSFSGPGTRLRPSRHSFFSTFQHWAIQVRGTVYEVTADDYGIPLDQQRFNVKVSSIEEWTRRRSCHDLRYEEIKLGLTDYPDRLIEELAYFIWDTRFRVHPKSYDLNKQNCQNFAFLLYGTIKIDIVKRKVKGSSSTSSSRSTSSRRSRESRNRVERTEWQVRNPSIDRCIITISNRERATWKPFPVRYTEYVQLGRLVRDSPYAVVAGSYFISLAGRLAGPTMQGLAKELARDVVKIMGADVIMLVGLAGAFLAIKVVERRSRDEVWIRNMRREALVIVEEARREHLLSAENSMALTSTA